ncbi:heavy metal translocating P-type ATPase [Anaerobacillus isosaccharinicus]|uniref:ATPase n=1 Tax=Anaerobacillus isosaccharinicus TaxID=1532552 RepID=A0A1S2L0C3_9BACI|nr:heavy metal translocating P-type ATPase [Anaerobacillus isosaccharinicus]MBA5584328.1 cadmium-translocating P-type ATPase [Anaerobacillus isosaccharinicus]QOY37274.1 cadmium-translocating P-type ATPase [Anaerobacillus isosaccharinicus]
MGENIGLAREKEQPLETEKSLFEEHQELIFAIVGGVFLAIGVLLQYFDMQAFAIASFLGSYIVGGYFKAKEGFTDLIVERSLNVELLMILAAIGAAIIGYWTEGAILIFIFSLSGALETYTLNKSHREISALMELQPEEATVLSGGVEKVIAVTALQVGDHVLVKPGERIPTDGKIIKGQTTIDEAAITGESMPVIKKLDDNVFSGTVNMNGAITVSVTKTNDETLFQKIIELVQTAKDEKSPSQLFIEKFESTYVKGVLIVVTLMMFAPHYLLGWTWTETFYRAMVMLVVASPCALVASIMPATLSAISNGARNGILFKGGVHLEALSSIKAIALDKTGTLTKGTPEVTNVLLRDGVSEQEFLYAVASIESHSTHPLAEAIVSFAKKQDLTMLTQPDDVEDITGWGITAALNGKKYKIGKRSFIGDDVADDFYKKEAEDLSTSGKTLVYVSDSEGIYGIIALQDTVRDVAIEAIRRFHEAGIYSIMITGDHEKTAQAIAKETNIDEYIANCLPETKVEEIKELKKRYGSVAMVGDGINDAPALAVSNVGIAMGTGTDVAIETADIVLVKNDLSKIAKAIKLSKRMNKIIKQNIVFSLSIIVLLIIGNFLQQVSLPLGVIGHEGSTILVILNGLRLLRG